MLGVGLGVLMFTIDTSIVNIALPTLVQVFHTDFATIQWVVLSYLLVVTALVLGAARLGDMLGKKNLYLSGLVVFTFSSLLCGLAPRVGWLIGFRALQGLGAVMISALGAAIVTEVFPSSERGRALGIIGAVVSLGVALGPTVGGLLIGLSDWRAIFLVNVPIGIFASFVVARSVPSSTKNPAKQRFDGLGALIMTVILVCFCLGMTYGQNHGFGSSTTVVLLLITILGLMGFLWIESRIKQPMLDLRLFRNLKFSLSLLTGLLVFSAITGVIFVVPFFLELVLHYPTQLVVPFGIGFGMFQSPNNSAILGEVPPERLGIASGLLSLSRTLGQTTGLPLLAALFAVLTLSHSSAVDVTKAPPEALVFGLQNTFRIAALVLFAATVVVTFLWRMERRE
ncbi:MFS transporter [Iningainema sp. BLCCT55]|uniref:MFS transporter n=2 Tax=Iningainema TaxID=1932705 RepID=A0A8J7CHV7_9CYAN|nr:MFS transporter [Iningainema tapete BLCC-T55]